MQAFIEIGSAYKKMAFPQTPSFKHTRFWNLSQVSSTDWGVLCKQRGLWNFWYCVSMFKLWKLLLGDFGSGLEKKWSSDLQPVSSRFLQISSDILVSCFNLCICFFALPVVLTCCPVFSFCMFLCWFALSARIRSGANWKLKLGDLLSLKHQKLVGHNMNPSCQQGTSGGGGVFSWSTIPGAFESHGGVQDDEVLC